MKKRILAITFSLCLIATTSFAGFADGGAFGATANYLKRVGTSIVPTVTNTYNLGSATKVWGTIYATAVSVVNWTVSGTWYWTGGNVTYLALTDNIETAIASATAGDTIVLASGTYTITNDIAIGKLIHLRGQGRGITTIYTASDINMITPTTTAGITISDLTISHEGAVTGSSKAMIRPEIGINIINVEFLNGATGGAAVLCNSVGNYTGAGTINIENCVFTHTGEIGFHPVAYAGMAGSTINIKNCVATSNAITSPWAVYGNALITNNTNSTMNLYNCSLSNPTDVVGGVLHTYNSNAKINAYNCTINGSGATALDVINVSGTITLYDTTLVNNTTSGTITYGGTVVTGGLKVNGTTSVGDRTDLVISGGVVTVAGATGYCSVDTESAAAADDLDTINGCKTGAILVIRGANSGRVATAKDGTGNLNLAGDFVFTNTSDTLTLFGRDDTTWMELSRSTNG